MLPCYFDYLRDINSVVGSRFPPQQLPSICTGEAKVLGKLPNGDAAVSLSEDVVEECAKLLRQHSPLF